MIVLRPSESPIKSIEWSNEQWFDDAMNSTIWSNDHVLWVDGLLVTTNICCTICIIFLTFFKALRSSFELRTKCLFFLYIYLSRRTWMKCPKCNIILRSKYGPHENLNLNYWYVHKTNPIVFAGLYTTIQKYVEGLEQKFKASSCLKRARVKNDSPQP